MKTIKAKEGMYLTQKNLENEGGRVFATSLYLADNDSEDNWRDATMQERYDWETRMESEMEEKLGNKDNAPSDKDNTVPEA